ncbi:MAG: hypothetical protein ABI743_04065, partial [bacterium]
RLLRYQYGEATTLASLQGEALLVLRPDAPLLTVMPTDDAAQAWNYYPRFGAMASTGVAVTDDGAILLGRQPGKPPVGEAVGAYSVEVLDFASHRVSRTQDFVRGEVRLPTAIGVCPRVVASPDGIYFAVTGSGTDTLWVATIASQPLVEKPMGRQSREPDAIPMDQAVAESGESQNAK